MKTMKTKVRINNQAPPRDKRYKEGEVGYIDGYVCDKHGSVMAAVVIGNCIYALYLFELDVIVPNEIPSHTLTPPPSHTTLDSVKHKMSNRLWNFLQNIPIKREGTGTHRWGPGPSNNGYMGWSSIKEMSEHWIELEFDRLKLVTLEDITKFRSVEFIKHRGCGKRTLHELHALLKAHNLEFGNDQFPQTI